MTTRLTDETIGQRLRRLRKERGLPQRDLTGPGVSHAYVSRIEADLRTPSVKAIRKLAAKLKVSPEYLERGLDVSAADERDLRLSETELSLRFGADAATAEKTYSEVLESAEKDGDKPSAARAHIGLGRLAFVRDDHWKALWHFEQALATGEISPFEDQQMYLDLAFSYRAAEMPERTIALVKEALEDFDSETPGGAPLQARFIAVLSLALTDLGQSAEAEKALEEATKTLRNGAKHESPAGIVWAQARHALETQRFQAALRKMRKTQALLDASEEHAAPVMAHVSLAEALLGVGNKDQALAELEQAETIAQRENWLPGKPARPGAARRRLRIPRRSRSLAWRSAQTCSRHRSASG